MAEKSQFGHRSSYKSNPSQATTRRRRNEVTTEIRRDKRDQVVAKRRNIEIEQPANAQAEFNRISHQLPEVLKGLYDQMTSGELTAQLVATNTIQKFLCVSQEPPVLQVVACGFVPLLINFLRRYDVPKLQLQCAWALTNICYHPDPRCTEEVVQQGAVDEFIKILRTSGDDRVKEQSMMCIGNIAGDGIHFRDMLLRKGFMAVALNVLENSTRVHMLRHTAWAIANLCRGKPRPDWETVSPAITYLAPALYSMDNTFVIDVTWALSYLSDGSDHQIKAVVDCGCVQQLVDNLLHANQAMQAPALRTVGNILSGDDLSTALCIGSGVLPNLRALLHSTRQNLRREACWSISNITAGNVQQIEQVLDANLVPPLITIMMQDGFDVRKEAAWALSNIFANGTVNQIEFLVDRGAIPAFADALTHSDRPYVVVALETFNFILLAGEKIAKKTGGPNRYAQAVMEANAVEWFEQLQEHPSQEVYEKAEIILVKYFDVRAQDNLGTGPKVSGDGRSFGFGSGGGAGVGGGNGFGGQQREVPGFVSGGGGFGGGGFGGGGGFASGGGNGEAGPSFGQEGSSGVGFGGSQFTSGGGGGFSGRGGFS